MNVVEMVLINHLYVFVVTVKNVNIKVSYGDTKRSSSFTPTAP